MLGDVLLLLVGAAVLVVVALAVTGGCVLATRQRHTRNQLEFPQYRPEGRVARWQHSRDDPEATGYIRPLSTDHDAPSPYPVDGWS